jgi:hypothetical protein
MEKKEIDRLWWWLLLIVVLAGIGYYTYSEVARTPEKPFFTKKVTPAKTTPLPQEQPSIQREKEQVQAGAPEERPSQKPVSEKEDCAQLQKNLSDFFRYLDHKKYVQHLYPDTGTAARFMEILARLSERPPIPAGEGIDPRIIIENVYHLYRALDHKDLRLIREVLSNEQETMEYQLDLFYKWFRSEGSCPDRKSFRPPMEIAYQYAGFFINTIGGRAYLFRRGSSLRLLVTYYCLLIIHEADKAQKNNYGIDVFPFIGPLKKDISYHPDLQFKSEYIEQLHQIQMYYMQKR